MANRTPQISDTVPEENLKIVPFADPKCRLCRLPYESLSYLHTLRYKKKWPHSKLIEYIRAVHGMGENTNRLVAHFNHHTSEGKKDNLIKKTKVTRLSKMKLKKETLTQVEKFSPETHQETSKEVERAYRQLTTMTSDFTQAISKAAELLTFDEKKVKKELKGMPYLVAMEKLAALQKAARDMVKDISMLRAPKIIVSQFLETALNEIIHDTGYVLASMCEEIQNSIVEQLNSGNQITGETFAKVFSAAGIQYKEMMQTLKREQMTKANAALADLEKII